MSKLKKFPSIPGNSNMDTGYRGLINQGATCYLNTVLQTFFMTPEFRDAVHKYSGPEKDKEKNLLFQLKKLFQNLEDGEYEVKTTGVTRSLGMMHRDVWVQQDVAEFFRKILNEVSKESLVSENYQSTVINSIKCLTCGTEASDNSRYLDIPLPLNTTDHSASMMYSVKKGLLDFLKTELLEGDNQSYCDKCEMKTDTETRYYFQRLPQILTLQLKRFEFDYYQMSYVKIQCPVEIPLELQFQKAPTENTEWCFSATVPQMRSRQKLKKHKETMQEIAVAASKSQDSVRYELFAICDHSGWYRGGHYTARIKSFENGKWYTFNDSFVHEASYLMEPGFTQSVKEGKVPCISSSTAYLLMYRNSETSKPETVNGNQRDPRSTETVIGNQRDPRSTETVIGNQTDPRSTETVNGNQRDPRSTETVNGNQRDPSSTETNRNQRDPSSTENVIGNQRDPRSTETNRNQRDPRNTETVNCEPHQLDPSGLCYQERPSRSHPQRQGSDDAYTGHSGAVAASGGGGQSRGQRGAAASGDERCAARRPTTPALLMNETSKPDPRSTETVNGNQRDPRSTETVNGNQRDPSSTETVNGNQRDPRSTETVNGNQRDPSSTETNRNQRDPSSTETVNGNQRDPSSTETVNGNQRDPRSTESPKEGIPDEDQKWDVLAILGKKKDGSWCLCLDYKINPVTKDSYLLNRINEALDYIVGSCWFSSLDLRSGNSEVQLSLEVRLKTVVSNDRERWQFQVKLFGLFMFECLVERVLVSVTRQGASFIWITWRCTPPGS
ncbi:ubiquitin carboxyl-terminal hydrolase 47-like isoform X5, partial [Acipenser oxyrinchus oxyrinchus]